MSAALRVPDLYRTFMKPGEGDGWLWAPWEYAVHTGHSTRRCRIDPTAPGRTMCGAPCAAGLDMGNPRIRAGVHHCPGCIAAGEPAQPAAYWRLEVARRWGIGDALEIRHTRDTEPTVLTLMPFDGARDLPPVLADLGWALEAGPHYDVRVDAYWARVRPVKPLQAALF
ncbi:hypothetical protein [Nocardiopsis dassonvillei]|uniref:hypothetical protein n=1 Tax=Nocardiopsis dassonvillei TaxID=2014 RepID=UPI003641C780